MAKVRAQYKGSGFDFLMGGPMYIQTGIRGLTPLARLLAKNTTRETPISGAGLPLEKLKRFKIPSWTSGARDPAFADSLASDTLPNFDAVRDLKGFHSGLRILLKRLRTPTSDASAEATELLQYLLNPFEP